MLSCLIKQAKVLEKELNEIRPAKIKLQREWEEAQEIVKARDERCVDAGNIVSLKSVHVLSIAVLESELYALREEHSKCGAEEAAPEPEPAAEPEGPSAEEVHKDRSA